MADRQRAPDWWLASDGKWYPPHLNSGAAPSANALHGSAPATEDHSVSIPSGLTNAVFWLTIATAAAFLAAAVFEILHAATLQSPTATAAEIGDAELVALAWSGIGFMGIAVSGLVGIVWIFQASKRFDRRGAEGRRWRGGWTVGAWFIPFASFVLPRLVLAELERIASSGSTGVPLGESWKSRDRSPVGDLWWLLWVIAILPLPLLQALLVDSVGETGTTAVALFVSAATYGALAGAGFAFAFLVRQIDRRSRSVSL